MSNRMKVADGDAQVGATVWTVEGEAITSGTLLGVCEVEPAGGGPWVTVAHEKQGWRGWPAASCYLRPWLSLPLGDDPRRGYGLARRCYLLLARSLETLRKTGSPAATAGAAKAVEIAEARAAVAFLDMVKAGRGLTRGQIAAAAEWHGILDRLMGEAMAEDERGRGAA